MKSTLKILFLLAAAMMLTMGFAACSDDDDEQKTNPSGGTTAIAPHYSYNVEIRGNEIVLLSNGGILSSRCQGYSIMLAPYVRSLTFDNFNCKLGANEYIALGDSCVLSLRGNSTLEMVKDATLYCSKLVLAPAGNDAATLTVRRQLDSFQQFYSIICCEKENELNQTAVRKGEDGLYEVTWTVQPRIER